MNHTEIKQRIRSVLTAMDEVSITGRKNRQIVTGCEAILTELLQAEFTADNQES